MDMDNNEVFIDDIYTPNPKNKKKPRDPKLDILLLQIITCAIILVCAYLIKMMGGDFYTDVKDLYESTFEDKTSVSEVLETGTGVTESDESRDDMSNSSTATSVQSEDTSSIVSENQQTTSIYTNSAESQINSGEEENDVTAYVFDFDTVKSAMNMSGGKANTLLMPITGTITSRFEYRNHPITGIYSMHGGLDIAADTGTNILSATSGIVKTVAQSNSYGLYVVVDHQNSFETLYAHCSSIDVKVGDIVSKGSAIAKVGTTGMSTGPHLHFEVRVGGCKLNPEWLLDKALTT